MAGIASPQVAALRAQRSQPGMPRPNVLPANGLSMPRAGQPAPPVPGQPLQQVAPQISDGGMSFTPSNPTLPATGIHQTLTPEGVRLQQMGPGGVVQGPVGGGGPASQIARSLPPGAGGDGGAGGGGGAAPPPVDPGWGLADIQNMLRTFAPPDQPRIEPPGPEDERAGQSAAFGRAADRIRSIGRGTEKRMLSDLTRRGVGGTGIETRARTTAARGTQADLGRVVGDQAIQSLNRTQGINDRNLAALVAQRGQDLSRSNWQMEGLSSIMGLLRGGVRPY